MGCIKRRISMNHHCDINPHLMMRHYFKFSIGFQYIIGTCMLGLFAQRSIQYLLSSAIQTSTYFLSKTHLGSLFAYLNHYFRIPQLFFHSSVNHTLVLHHNSGSRCFISEVLVAIIIEQTAFLHLCKYEFAKMKKKIETSSSSCIRIDINEHSMVQSKCGKACFHVLLCRGNTLG